MFDLIVEFVAVVAEEFDAVVFVRVVRSGENDAGIGAQRSGDVSNTWCGQRPDDENIDAERGDARDERVLEHVTRKARVLAQHDFRTNAFGKGARVQLHEHARGGAPKFQRRLCRDRFDVSDAADSVRPENLFLMHHGVLKRSKRDS